MKNTAVIVCICFLFACSSRPVIMAPTPVDLPARPWSKLDETCIKVDTPAGPIVQCPPEDFLAGLDGADKAWGCARKCLIDLAAAGEVSDLQISECLARASECQRQRDDPIRSPVLWGIVSGVLFFAAGVLTGVYGGD